MERMKAVSIQEYGSPEVLTYGDVPIPEPGADEVLIRVYAASVNRIDAAVRAGYVQGWFQHTLPLVLGWDVSGVVEAVGPAVTGYQVGDEVYGRGDVNRNGAYAEHVVMRASEIARKPTSLDHIQAAAVPHAALTAWQSLFDAGNLSDGQTVLIHAAAGGVGHLAVQLARHRGARVIGTASSQNHDFLRELGAHEVVDYNGTRFEEVAHGVDVVFDTMGGETQQRSWVTLRPAGTLVSVVQPPSEESAAAYSAQARFIGSQSSSAQLEQIAKLIDAGHVKPAVSTILPLKEARQAHILIEGMHTRGKIVLNVAG